MNSENELKTMVRDFWDESSCGEVYAAGTSERDFYAAHSKTRYELEPYIFEFAGFHDGQGKDVLEIGVGMGADHKEWAQSRPRSLAGIDLTPRAIEHTRKRLGIFGLASTLGVGDAERLPFDDESFDLVYSWGVLHHSPDTATAIAETHRVLRPNGIARIMIYHTRSLTGYMLWIRYALLAGRPFRPLKEIYANYLESPGTKAFSVAEARDMCAMFAHANVRTQLSFGDLLEGAVGQRHSGVLLTIAKRIWPRRLLRRALRNHGLLLLIEARK